MIDGSGSESGSIPLTIGSGSGSRRPKNMWIRIRIGTRIRNTGKNILFLVDHIADLAVVDWLRAGWPVPRIGRDACRKKIHNISQKRLKCTGHTQRQTPWKYISCENLLFLRKIYAKMLQISLKLLARLVWCFSNFVAKCVFQGRANKSKFKFKGFFTYMRANVTAHLCILADRGRLECRVYGRLLPLVLFSR